MTVLRNTDIVKLARVDPLVTQLPTPPLQEDRSISDGETAQNYAKPEFEDEGVDVSSIPTHSPLIPASQPSRPASLEKPAECLWSKMVRGFSPNPQAARAVLQSILPSCQSPQIIQPPRYRLRFVAFPTIDFQQHPHSRIRPTKTLNLFFSVLILLTLTPPPLFVHARITAIKTKIAKKKKTKTHKHHQHYYLTRKFFTYSPRHQYFCT